MSEFQIVDLTVKRLIERMPEYEDKIFFWRKLLDNGDLIIRLENSNLNAVIDIDGMFKLGFNYEFCNSYIEGLMQIKCKGKYGFIDMDYNLIIPPMYDYLSFFTNGYAKAKLNKLMYSIDLNNNKTLIIYDTEFKKVRLDFNRMYK